MESLISARIIRMAQNAQQFNGWTLWAGPHRIGLEYFTASLNHVWQNTQ
jgi:hypothetical protein